MKGTTDLPVLSIKAPVHVRGVNFADHRGYWDHGYDAVLITDTAIYRNDTYHRSTDTSDTLDYPRLAKVAVQVYEAVAGIAHE